MHYLLHANCCFAHLVMLEGRHAIQRDLDRLKKWQSWVQGPAPGLGQCPISIQIGRCEWIQSSPVEKHLGILVDEKIEKSPQCVFVPQKAWHILGCITSSVASRSREAILPLYSAQVRPCLGYCIRYWSPQHREDMDLLERVQRRPQNRSEGWNISATRKG